jgi:hypothetical protein
MSHYDVPKPNLFADAVLEAAKGGDWRPLDSYLDRGLPIPDNLRQYFRRLLPFAPRPKAGVKRASSYQRSLEIAAAHWRAKQDGAHNPTAYVAQRFSVSPRKVQQACKAFAELPADMREETLQVLARKRPEPPAVRPFDESVPIEGRRATMRRLGRTK